MSFEFIQCISQTSPHTRTCTKNSMHFVWELIRNAKKNAKTFETNKISDENLSSKECIICYLQQFPLETEAGPPWDVLPVHKYEYYIYSISYIKTHSLWKTQTIESWVQIGYIANPRAKRATYKYLNTGVWKAKPE